jgi:hypothetical protein
MTDIVTITLPAAQAAYLLKTARTACYREIFLGKRDKPELCEMVRAIESALDLPFIAHPMEGNINATNDAIAARLKRESPLS